MLSVHANIVAAEQLHPCMKNETLSLADLQALTLILAGITISNRNQGIKSGRCAVSFGHAWMQLPSWNFVCMNEHM